MNERIQLKATVLAEQSGHRIDQAAAELFGDFSRARLQEWIKSGRLTVDGIGVRSKDKVRTGNVLALDAELEPGRIGRRRS